MNTNTIYRRMNDHPVGRTAMTMFDIVILAFSKTYEWLYLVRFPHKRKVFTTLTALAFMSVWWTLSDTEVSESVTAEPATTFSPIVVSPQSGPITYDTGRLAGRKAGDLYAAWLGYRGNVIPRQLTIDWGDHLDELWLRKGRRIDMTPVARQTGQVLVAEYAAKDPGLTNLESYQQTAGRIASTICDKLDWGKVQRTYHLNDRKGALLKRVSCQMGGRVMLSYLGAELFPSADGDLNVQMLDFLLRHAGRRYVETLPALNDGKTSFGPFQFTDNALYVVGNERRGASNVNLALPAGLAIRDSTASLRGDDHFKAAFMFAISNLADGIQGLNARQVANFEKVAGPKGVDVAQFIATAHNKPYPSFGAMRRWLAAGGNGNYADYVTNSASRGYALKTLRMYQALSPTR